MTSPRCSYCVQTNTWDSHSWKERSSFSGHCDPDDEYRKAVKLQIARCLSGLAVCRSETSFQLSYGQNMLVHKQWVLTEVVFVGSVSRVYRGSISTSPHSFGWQNRTCNCPEITSFCGLTSLVKSRDEGRFPSKLWGGPHALKGLHLSSGDGDTWTPACSTTRDVNVCPTRTPASAVGGHRFPLDPAPNQPVYCRSLGCLW